jgi:hypothetical protein
MRKLVLFFSTILLLVFLSSIDAFAAVTVYETVMNNDGSYYTSTIEVTSFHEAVRSSTVTSSKTKMHYSSNGDRLWHVKVTGSFTYGNGTAVCNSASVSTGVYASGWYIINRTATASGNQATATATAKQVSSGVTIQTITSSVTLTCSSSGVLS